MMKKVKKWLFEFLLKKLYPQMPFCVYPIFRKGKAGYDSWMIKGYSYTLIIPNMGTENIIHLSHNDFSMHEESLIDEHENEHSIEDTNQPFFTNWVDAYEAASLEFFKVKKRVEAQHKTKLCTKCGGSERIALDCTMKDCGFKFHPGK